MSNVIAINVKSRVLKSIQNTLISECEALANGDVVEEVRYDFALGSPTVVLTVPFSVLAFGSIESK